MKVAIDCIDCGKLRWIDATKNNPSKYKEKYPRCHKCGFNKKLSSKTWFKNGSISWNKGKMVKKKEEYSNGYDAVHEWVERWIGLRKKCEKCGSKKFLELSNKSGNYFREKSDWQTLCKKCHHRYDYYKFRAREAFYT